MDLQPEYSAQCFRSAADKDRELYLTDDYLSRWLFVDRLYARGERKEMSFYEYQGPQHVAKYLRWIDKFRYSDWFGANTDSLAVESAQRDETCLANLGIPTTNINLDAIGTYNAQDYRLQRFYPVPDAQKPRTILDFGAGHGRMANLALRPNEAVTERMIAVDGIEGSYLTQRAYYHGLGLNFSDYIDRSASNEDFDFGALFIQNQLIHLPTWRMDLIPNDSIDLVCCVQVLKELPRQLVVYVLAHFARVVKPGGAIYIRDHIQNHHPNQMPIDQLLTAYGFVLEFAPQIRDRVAIHGLPRIWRRINPELYFEVDEQTT